ncbi:MAG: pilus assembly protein PilP [Magnetococcales bacterium]|nr:pilus assembly protein PilP [Magnetococcales bacterium]
MKIPAWIMLAALAGSSSTVLAQTPAPGAQSTELPPFDYRAEGRRDPFQPPAVAVALEEATNSKVPAKKREKEFLESFQIDSLKLVAIVLNANRQKGSESTGQSVAMVEDPEGIGHLIQVGSYLGVNEGKIIEIRDGEITIEEPAPKLRDPHATQRTTLHLHTPDEKRRENASIQTKH